MKQLAWLTDIHLNFLRSPDIEAFFDMLAGSPADVFILSGDIGEAPNVAEYLQAIAKRVSRPVYFVLGNHDFYRGSIAGVRTRIRELGAKTPNLHWLPDAGVVPLGESVGLVGHDGWGDGRLGDYLGSDVLLNDFALIAEFGGFDEDRSERLQKLMALGDEAAAHFQAVLPEALARFQHVLAITHVPPFREACWYEGRTSGEDWLPFFTCQAIGDTLMQTMKNAPDRALTVLCGHTHGQGTAQVLPNLRVLTGGAVYGRPAIQQLIHLNELESGMDRDIRKSD